MSLPSPIIEGYAKQNTSMMKVAKIPLKVALLAICITLGSSLAHSSTLKMDATCSSETSIHFQQIQNSSMNI
jgi:septal ring-binding cell division protein DamX